MKIFLIATTAVMLLVLLLLLIKIGLYVEIMYTKKDGFKAVVKFRWLFFEKQLVPSVGKNDRKLPNTEDKKDKESDSHTIDIIKCVAAMVKELVWLPSKVLVFKKQCVWCKVALDDPMKNGITYAAVSGVLMEAMQIILCRFKTDEYKLRVTPDFVAKDGISIKNVTLLELRPLVLIFFLIYAYTKSRELRSALNTLLNEIKKDKPERK